MAVVIFALGIKSANGLVKSTINTANAFAERNIDVSIVNIVGTNGGLDYLDAAFPLNERVKKYSLDAMYPEFCENIAELENTIFHEENQQFLKVIYNQKHANTMVDINKKLSKNDLVIFSHPLAMVLYVKANPQSDVKKIIQVHGNYIEEVDNFNLLKDYVNEVDYIQCVSKHMRDELVELIDCDPQKVICIYNIAQPLEIIKQKDDTLKRISIIGSIQKRKNQLDAIKLLTQIKDRNVILQIYGKALKKDYMDRLNEYIRLHHLTDRVLFKDVASEREIYENTDVAIMTSEHEGFGYIFLECAMYQIPVLAYDFPYGAKEFSQNGRNGCLFAMGDYKGMAAKIKEILNNPILSKEITAINFKHFSEEYSEQKIVSNYLSLYEETSNCFNLNNLLQKTESKINNIIKEVSHKIGEVEEPNLLTHQGEKTRYHIFDIVLDSLPKNYSFYYIYKKVKFDIEPKILQLKKFFFKESQVRLEIKIPLLSINSFNKPMSNFRVCMDLDTQRIVIGEISKQTEFLNYCKKEHIKHISTGISTIKDIDHILNPQGMWIRYPSSEPILFISDEEGIKIPYETKNMVFYGKNLPFFSVSNNMYKQLTVNMVSGKKLTINFSEYSYKSIFLMIQELEVKYKLFDLKIQNIYFWELIRANIFESILESTGVFSKHFNKHSEPIKNVYSGVKKLSDLELNGEHKLIFEFPRKKEKDYKTFAVQENFPSAIVIEYPQSDGYSDKVYDEQSNHYPIYEFLQNKTEFTLKYDSSDNRIIKSLKNLFFEKIGIEIEFALFIKNRILKYLKEFSYFDSFFQKNKVSEVFIPSSYWSAGIVSAAKQNGIIVSDIQYALISKYHPSFSFPVPARAYGADRIYLWSKYWNLKEVPFNKSIVLDTNYFNEKREEYCLEKITDLLYDVAFVSQNRICQKIVNEAYKYATHESDKHIVFCPHPDDHTDNEVYQKLKKLPNVHINEGQDSLIAISKSRNVVGVYSTTLFEALALRKNVYVLKINGYEVMEKEIEKGFFKLIDTSTDLINLEHDLPNIDFQSLLFN